MATREQAREVRYWRQQAEARGHSVRQAMYVLRTMQLEPGEAEMVTAYMVEDARSAAAYAGEVMRLLGGAR